MEDFYQILLILNNNPTTLQAKETLDFFIVKV